MTETKKEGNGKDNLFCFILSVFILAFIVSLIVLFFCVFPCGSDDAIKQEVKSINTTITDQLVNFTDWNNSTKLEFRENTFREMISWGLQRQITWGVMIFTVMTLFLMVFIEIRKMTLDLDTKNGGKLLIIFLIGGLILLVGGSLGVVMLLYYYKEVYWLEYYLLVHPIESPISKQFCVLLCVGILIVVLFALSYCLIKKCVKKSVCHSLTYII
jgi:hypothetical protein